MTWKEAFKEVKKDMDLKLPDGSRIELMYPTIILCVVVIIAIVVFLLTK